MRLTHRISVEGPISMDSFSSKGLAYPEIISSRCLTRATAFDSRPTSVKAW